MCQSQNFVAKSGVTSVSIANPNLDGSGPMSLVLTASLDGTVLQSITIKAIATNAQGFVRFFIQPNGGTGNPFLWREVPVPANVKTQTNPAYQTTIRASYTMQSGDELYASTENGDIWNILAEAVSWENCDCPA